MDAALLVIRAVLAVVDGDLAYARTSLNAHREPILPRCRGGRGAEGGHVAVDAVGGRKARVSARVHGIQEHKKRYVADGEERA